MTIKEFRATIEALEAAHAETRDNSNNPHETARRFIRAVGADTAAQCVAAMVRRLHWDGRISHTARQWGDGVSLSEEWERRIDDAYTDRIHAAHLSQIAQAMPAELEHAQAEAQPAADRYLEQVAQADSLDELDTITEAAANDDTLTGAEYEAIHAAALRKAQDWDPQNQREKPAQSEGTEEPTSRPMYKTIPEALAIFDGLDPASVHTITEGVSGETMTGTPTDLVRRIIEQDRERNGAIDHSAETVEGWAIIETAYAISGNEAVTNQDGTHKWVGLHGRG